MTGPSDACFEERPRRNEWSDREREVCGPQTISEMYVVACTPEQYSLVFRNIAYSGGWKELLAAQFDRLWYDCAEWVSSQGDWRRDQYNNRIGERNREREALKSQISVLAQDLESIRREAMISREAAAREIERLMSTLRAVAADRPGQPPIYASAERKRIALAALEERGRGSTS